jgi:hypothetical protein
LLPTLRRRPGVTASATLIREIDSRVSASEHDETR